MNYNTSTTVKYFRNNNDDSISITVICRWFEIYLPYPIQMIYHRLLSITLSISSNNQQIFVILHMINILSSSPIISLLLFYIPRAGKANELFVIILYHHLLTSSKATPSSLLLSIGFLLFFAFMSNVVSGFFLIFYYCPNWTLAFLNKAFVIDDVNIGWLLVNVHMHGASLYMVLIYLHLLRNLWYLAFSRHLSLWFSGILLLLLSIVESFIGYCLFFMLAQYESSSCSFYWMNSSCLSPNDDLDLWMLVIMDWQLHSSTHSPSSSPQFNILNLLLFSPSPPSLYSWFPLPFSSSPSSLLSSTLILDYPSSYSSPCIRSWNYSSFSPPYLPQRNMLFSDPFESLESSLHLNWYWVALLSSSSPSTIQSDYPRHSITFISTWTWISLRSSHSTFIHFLFPIPLSLLHSSSSSISHSSHDSG